MDSKKRAVFVLLIAFTMVAGMLASFGMPFLTNKIPEVKLPSLEQISGETTANPEGESGGVSYVPVTVTTETVQNVIASLDRANSYYRKLTITRYWNEGVLNQHATETVQTWADAGFMKTVVLSSGGMIRQWVTTPDTVYLWYGSERAMYQRPSHRSDTDFVQSIPNYEDILQWEKETIQDAGYEEKNGVNCIYVEGKHPDLGYLERYWVSTESGLLFAAESEDAEGNLIYSMQEESITVPTIPGTKISLPDGTVLRETEQSEIQEEN